MFTFGCSPSDIIVNNFQKDKSVATCMATLLLVLILTVCFGLRMTDGQHEEITAQVTRSSSGSLTAGQIGFSLSCDVTGTDNLNTPIIFTYQWRKYYGDVIFGQQGSTLSLSPLTASNAGGYTCSVTVIFTSLSSTVTVNSINYEFVLIQLPAPTFVTVTNGSVNVGSDVILTCTVKLSPAVDVLVTVNIVWTGPAGFMTIIARQSLMRSTTSRAIVSSFVGYLSGNYTCTATVSSTSSLLNNSMAFSSATLRITVGVYLSLKGVLYLNNSFILITEIEQTNTTSNNGLQCITDRMPCCRGSQVGEWLFPDNGGVIQTISMGPTTFYRNRGFDDGTVNLNRVNTDVMMPTGRFCCVVPDATSTNVTVCANIVLEIPITMPPSMSTPTNPTEDRYRPTQDVVIKSSCSCALEVGVLVVVMLLLVCLIAIVITVVFVYMWRKRIAGKIDLGQSSNKPNQLYENPDKLTSTTRGQGNYELRECSAYESTTTNPQPHPAELDQSGQYEL